LLAQLLPLRRWAILTDLECNLQLIASMQKETEIPSMVVKYC